MARLYSQSVERGTQRLERRISLPPDLGLVQPPAASVPRMQKVASAMRLEPGPEPQQQSPQLLRRSGRLQRTASIGSASAYPGIAELQVERNGMPTGFKALRRRPSFMAEPRSFSDSLDNFSSLRSGSFCSGSRDSSLGRSRSNSLSQDGSPCFGTFPGRQLSAMSEEQNEAEEEDESSLASHSSQNEARDSEADAAPHTGASKLRRFYVRSLEPHPAWAMVARRRTPGAASAEPRQYTAAHTPRSLLEARWPPHRRLQRLAAEQRGFTLVPEKECKRQLPGNGGLVYGARGTPWTRLPPPSQGMAAVSLRCDPSEPRAESGEENVFRRGTLYCWARCAASIDDDVLALLQGAPNGRLSALAN